MKYVHLLILFFFVSDVVSAQQPVYWNKETQLIPWKPVFKVTNVQRIDLDKDGDIDVLKTVINDSIPVVWIDDDDDMSLMATEGDTDNDCLLIDKNRDGIYAGPHDFSMDWIDEDKDGKADIQLIVSNAGLKVRHYYDWGADFMYVMDTDKDQIMHFVDWNRIVMKAWEHYGHGNFYKDYHGNSTFLKMHASSFRIHDLRFNWENPFIFYDTDGDKLTEMAIRLVDSPVFRDPNNQKKNNFDKIDTSLDVQFTKKIDYAAITWDIDNDNSAGNEFDFDMSLLFRGKGFSYEDQEHHFPGLKGLAGTDSFFYDARWRQIDRLYYPDRDTAYSMIFKKGDWQQVRLVFDEDDDCHRWERVEFYDPLDLWKTGIEQGGLDNNSQADAVGDRGEFDVDNSGKGKLYVGFDGKLHLFGAEWGAWRIDQTAYSYQGFGGFYEKWNRKRLQLIPEKFALIKYEDADGNGFIDKVLYDLDGDRKFEDSVSFHALNISDHQPLIHTADLTSAKLAALFTTQVEKSWAQAQQLLSLAAQMGINTDWYAFYKAPHSLQEKYDYAFWIRFYLYQDMRYEAMIKKDGALKARIEKAYYTGDWSSVLNKPSTVRLATVLQSGMVVQQEKPFKIWGKAAAGTALTIHASWNPVVFTVKAENNGTFYGEIEVPKANKGDYTKHQLRVVSKDTTIVLDDLMIGEVWFLSGQSNMEMSMRPYPPYHKGVIDNVNEIAKATIPGLRVYRNEKKYDAALQEFTDGKWWYCEPANVALFSGVGFYFGRKLQQQLDIPVGLVQSSIGSASCQAFMSRAALSYDAELKAAYLDPYDRNPNDKIPLLRPMLVYNAMIHPLQPLSVRGVLWYQGESNAGEIQLYPALMARLVESWRAEFKNPEMPFYYVQMTPFNWNKKDSAEHKYAFFREGQANVKNLVKNVDMVCTMDVGDPQDIHPTNKKPVGERLAGLALYNTYGITADYPYGPIYSSMMVKSDKVLINFMPESVNMGLNTRDGKSPQHFYVAGEDKVFHPAVATIKGKSIVLTSTLVKKPVAVRYAFTNYPVTNLQNKNGLPVYPFRTDNWSL